MGRSSKEGCCLQLIGASECGENLSGPDALLVYCEINIADGTVAWALGQNLEGPYLKTRFLKFP